MAFVSLGCQTSDLEMKDSVFHYKFSETSVPSLTRFLFLIKVQGCICPGGWWYWLSYKCFYANVREVFVVGGVCKCKAVVRGVQERAAVAMALCSAAQ